MPNRSRKEEKIYRKHRAHLKLTKKRCEFCNIDQLDKQFVDESEYFKIINNIFPYSIWDERRVTDHLMIVPKEHTETLNSLGKEAAIEYVKLISQYESEGYNLYARTPSSNIKSVPHQHTHLIKTGGRRLKTLFYLKRPYVRIVL